MCPNTYDDIGIFFPCSLINRLHKTMCKEIALWDKGRRTISGYGIYVCKACSHSQELDRLGIHVIHGFVNPPFVNNNLELINDGMLTLEQLLLHCIQLEYYFLLVTGLLRHLVTNYVTICKVWYPQNNDTVCSNGRIKIPFYLVLKCMTVWYKPLTS